MGFCWSTKTTQPVFFSKKRSTKIYHFEAFKNDHSGELLFRTFCRERIFNFHLRGVVGFFPAGASVYSSSTGAWGRSSEYPPRIVEWLAPDGFFPANRKQVITTDVPFKPVNYTIHTGVNHQLTID